MLDAEIKPKFLYLPRTKLRKFFTEKKFLREMGSGRLNKQRKKAFFIALATVIKKDSTMSIRKHVNELKVYEKIERTAIKQDLSPDFNLLDYAIWGVNKTYATSHSNIGSLKTAIEEDWNKMSEELILKTCKAFRRCGDTIIEKSGGHIESICCFESIFLFKKKDQSCLIKGSFIIIQEYS